MARRAAATARLPPHPAAVPAPRESPPPPAARRRRRLPGRAAPLRAASGRSEEELQEGAGAAATSGAERPAGLHAQHGPERKRGREAARKGSPPARKARATPAAASLLPSVPVRSPMPATIEIPAREVNRPVTRSFSQLIKSARANAAMANKNGTSPAHPARPCTTQKPAGHPQHAPRVGATFSQENNKLSEGTGTTTMRTRADHMEFLRRRVILAESEVAEEKENVRRGLEAIRWKDAQLKELRKRCNAMDKDIRRKDAQLKVAKEIMETKERLFQIMESIWMDKAETDAEMKAQKEAEMQELKVQKEAQVQEVMKENVRLLRIVDKKEALLQAMSEQCKLLAQQMP